MDGTVIALLVVIVVVIGFVLLTSVGKAIGAPDPATLTDEGLQQRYTSELNWLVKYSDLPFAKKSDPKLKAMHDKKSAYQVLLMTELKKRGLRK
jgi:hypothetical protein